MNTRRNLFKMVAGVLFFPLGDSAEGDSAPQPPDFTGWQLYDDWNDVKFLLNGDTITVIYPYCRRDDGFFLNPAWDTAPCKMCYGIDPQGRGWRIIYEIEKFKEKLRPWPELTLEMIQKSVTAHTT